MSGLKQLPTIADAERNALVEQLLGQIEHLLEETRRQTPDGALLLGGVPASLNGGHFGPALRRYALYQHHHCHVTQALLHEQLREWDIDMGDRIE